MSPSPTTAAVDWGEVRARLDRIDAAVREALQPSPGRVRDLLEERARALARVPSKPPRDDEVIEVVTFSVAGESYAVETRFVRRVVRPGGCTPVPAAPAVLRGVVNLRGEVLAVFDLLTLFGAARGRGGPAEGSYVIVLGAQRDELGVVADAVHEVKPLGVGELLEPSVSLEGAGRHLLRGLTADALVVLDGGALLRDDRLFIDQGEELGA
jgi:purine-binding chemotaxis protein CheW